MLKISDTLKYKTGNQVESHVMYVNGSDPLEVVGRLEFSVIGECKLNGIKFSNTSKVMVLISKPASIEVGKDSAVLFMKAPQIAKRIPQRMEVEPVPDALTAQERQLDMVMTNWLQRKGIPVESLINAGVLSESTVDNEAEEVEEDAEPYDLKLPVDTPHAEPHAGEERPQDTELVQSEPEGTEPEPGPSEEPEKAPSGDLQEAAS